MKRIESFFIGQKASFKQKITPEIVKKFVDLTGDDNPLHTDKEYAEKSPYKGIVTHGMLSASFISTMIGKHIPGEGALWVSQNIQFVLPVRLNDELTIEAEITKIVVKENLLTLRCIIYNHYGQKVLSGEGQVKVIDSEDIPEKKETPSLKPISKETNSPKKTSEKVALVTGASRGIGAATALKLASQGYFVIVNYRNETEMAGRIVNRIISGKGKATAFKADITNEEELTKLFNHIREEHGSLTVLVNNASPKIIEKNLTDSHWSDILFQLEGQVKSAFTCIKQAVPLMENIPNANIINIGSVVSQGIPPAKWGAYSISKSALENLTKCFANELGPKSIRVNMVSPGMTDTFMISEIPEKQRLLYAAQTPLRRLGTPEDAANIIGFLASEEANFITGANYLVSGGKNMI